MQLFFASLNINYLRRIISDVKQKDMKYLLIIIITVIIIIAINAINIIEKSYINTLLHYYQMAVLNNLSIFASIQNI